jgi:hypothetical protein
LDDAESPGHIRSPEPDPQILQIKQAIVSAAVEAFFPGVSPDAKEFLSGVTIRESASIFESEAMKYLDGKGNAFFDRLRCFHGFAVYAPRSLENWIGGFDPDVLDAFPGQRLIRERNDVERLWNAELRWRMQFGSEALCTH